eukprot:TRINITY_DN3212_c2_g1_i1.p1 TRINITY_DN3212_c2_g1~~TRINITY_DN3212_c2_g1_i1.p1  ORF type:complete len:252 (+),score=10.38 TRINITY_DN3212_c2_g1_i1:117-872(+)
MLPSSGTSSLSCASVGPRLPEYFRRMVHFNQMDFDSALAQMMYLCTSPEKAFKVAKSRKLTKNHWHRDDPAFLVLLTGAIITACISYYIAIMVPLGVSASGCVRLVLYELGVNFILFGVLLSTLFWYCSNKYLHVKGQMHSVPQPVEWQYSFDIHCNALFSFMMVSTVVHFFLLPWILKDSFSGRLLSNFIFSAGLTAYFYVSFRGYLELPFLEKQEFFLYPIMTVAIYFVLSIVTSFNMSSYIINSWVSD